MLDGEIATCTDDYTTESYGYNPYMYKVTPLFRDLDAMKYYEPHEISTYTTATGSENNVYPAFKAYRMHGGEDVFPVVFSNTLEYVPPVALFGPICMI